MSKKVVLSIVVVVLVVAGVVGLYLLLGDPEDGDEGIERQDEPLVDDARRREVEKKRGPRPESGRLPEGVHQVEDTGRALTMAQEALERVDKELAQATDDETRARLEKKKELVEKQMNSLMEARDSREY